MAEMTEAKIYSAFGLEPPAAADGAQVQEVADPAVQSGAADPEPTGDGVDGAQVQEVADPVVDPAEPEGDPPAEPEGTPQGKQTLTPEQRRQNAARRRQEEQQKQQQAIDNAVAAAVQAEKQKNDAAMTDFFTRLGLKNSITGEPITSMEQFNAFKSAQNAAQLEQDLKKGKLTPQGLEQAISDHPLMKQAQAVIEKSQAAERQAQQIQDKARIDGELAEISKLDPSIRSVADLLAMDNSQEFYAHVKGGKSFLEAFKLTNFERLTQQKAQAAAQQAMNNARGKDHLTAVGNSRGAGAESVPAAEMAMYRKLLPNATEAEIQAHYNKYKNS